MIVSISVLSLTETTFLKNNSVCAGYMQKIIHQEILIYHHFTPKHPRTSVTSVNSLFDALWKKPIRLRNDRDWTILPLFRSCFW